MSKLNTGKVISGRLKLLLFLLIAGLLEIASFSGAKAQMINPFGLNNRATLGKEDYKLALAAVGKLLNETPPAVGRYDTWSNAASGNHGKFTILDIFVSNGMPCRKVKSQIVYSRAGSPPKSFTLNVCKLQNGEWKTVA